MSGERVQGTPVQESNLGWRNLRIYAINSAVAITTAATLVACGVGNPDGSQYDEETEQGIARVLKPEMTAIGQDVLAAAQINPNFLTLREPNGDTRISAKSFKVGSATSITVYMGTNPDGKPDPSMTSFVDIQQDLNLKNNNPKGGIEILHKVVFVNREGNKYYEQEEDYLFGADKDGDQYKGNAAYTYHIVAKDGATEILLSGILDTTDSMLFSAADEGKEKSPIETAKAATHFAEEITDRAINTFKE